MSRTSKIAVIVVFGVVKDEFREKVNNNDALDIPWQRWLGKRKQLTETTPTTRASYDGHRYSLTLIHHLYHKMIPKCGVLQIENKNLLTLVHITYYNVCMGVRVCTLVFKCNEMCQWIMKHMA